jgi:hypothetical protein
LTQPQSAAGRGGIFGAGWFMKDVWFLYLILGAFPALILVAAVVKYVEVLKARNWSTAQGRVITSTSEDRRVKKGVSEDADTETRNFAKIVYEYKVADHTYRCDRVTIGEDLGNIEVAETIAKYPVGKAVAVYYNPNKRTQAVLERDLPPFVWKGVIIIILVFIAIIVGSVVGFEKLASFMSGVVRNPKEAPFVTACLGFAALTALFVYAFMKQISRAKSWPIAPGKIESIDVTSYVNKSDDDGRTRYTTMYRPQVVYSYNVAGVRYKGEGVPGAQVATSSEASAKKAAAKFTKGTSVEVHYDPANPTQSAVDPRAGWAVLLWIIPVAFVALAYAIGH